jgi:hypothetical protein
MSLTTLGWLFTLGVLAHNAEEAWQLPAWSAQAGKWYAPVSAPVFRFAVGVLSGCFVLIAATASFSPAGSIGAYLMAGYVLAMLLNVFMPHVLASVVMRRYMPGTATALLLNLPLGLFYLRRAWSERYIEPHVFGWAGPLVVFGLLAAIPMLFALGRRVRAASA